MSLVSASSAWFKWLVDQIKSADGKPQSSRTVLLAVAASVGTTVTLFSLHGLFKRKHKVLGIIPARWGSSRFNGKPLTNILGKPMIQRTWENAKLARTPDRIVIATDDERIASCGRGFGAEVVLTSRDCKNGSERCAEALSKLGSKFDLVVNVQGDEPLLEPDAIDAVVYMLLRRPKAVSSTAVADLPATAAADPNRVKCVVDQEGNALYFSRALIPNNQNGVPSNTFPYMLHIGLQCYRVPFLKKYVALQSTPLEMEEQLEQLRILETGHKIAVVKVRHHGHGVDVPGDVKKVEEMLAKRDLSKQ